MSWQRVRHLASGVLVLAALILGGVVGNVLLLGQVDQGDTALGQLSSRLAAPIVARTTAPSVTSPSVTTARPPKGDGPKNKNAGPRGERESDD